MMLGIVGIGLLCAAFLPAMKINLISFLGTIPMEISLREAMNALVNTGRGWAVLLAIVGLIIIARTLLMYDDMETDRSRWWLTVGAVLTLLFPLNLLRAMDSVVADVTAESDGMAMVDTSLAPGLIIASIAVIVVAALGWYADSQVKDTPTYVSPLPPTQSASRPAWMTEQARH